FVHQVRLDGRLLDAVLAERAAGLRFGGRHLDAWPVNPDRAAVQQVLDLPAQRLDQVLRAGEREADHVDHDVRLQRPHARPELAGLRGLLAVDRDLAPRFPRGVGLVRLAPAAADGRDVEAGFDQARDEVGAHVAAAANDHYV